MELRSDLEEGEWSGGMVSIKGKAGAKDQWQDGVEGLTEAQIQGARDGSWRLANEKQNISCSGLSFLHDPTLTSVHDYWKNQL